MNPMRSRQNTQKKSSLHCECPKYLLIKRVVFYIIKIKQRGPGTHKETFWFFTRYSLLLEKHQAFLKNIPKNSPIYSKLPSFPPKNYCKPNHLKRIQRRQKGFKRYFQGMFDLFDLSTIPQFQKCFNFDFQKNVGFWLLNPENPCFCLPYNPLKEYIFAINSQYNELEVEYEEQMVQEKPEEMLFIDKKPTVEDVKSILFVDTRNQKILKYSNNLTFILFLDEKLGKGAYGEVYKGCTNMNEKEIYAIKEICIPSKYSDNYNIITTTARNEINILKSLNHEHVVKYIESFENAQHIYLVMEFCNDGNLENYIKSNDLAEKDVISLFKQIVAGFKYLHEKGVLHRDVKPSNFLLDNMKIKISDFGFARVILNEAFTQSHIGTYPFMAPQILQGKPYNNMSDIWSLGITLFFMLFKRIPWNSENPFHLDREIREKLKKNLLFEAVPKQRISKYAEDLLIRMIVYDENLRINWEKLFQHPLLQEEPVFGINTRVNASIIENKRQMHTKSDFAKHKTVKKNIFIQTNPVNCMKFYCGGEETAGTPEHHRENTAQFVKKDNNLADSLGHYSIIQTFEPKYLEESEFLIQRKKNKSTNSALLTEEINRRSKKESIEDLKNFQSLYTLRKQQPFVPRKTPNFEEEGPTNNEEQLNADYPSINRDTRNPSTNEKIDKNEGEEYFFIPFGQQNNLNFNFDSKNNEDFHENNDENACNNRDSSAIQKGNHGANTAKFNILIEEEKTLFSQRDSSLINSKRLSQNNGNIEISSLSLVQKDSFSNNNSKDLTYTENNDRISFDRLAFSKENSSKLEENKEEFPLKLTPKQKNKVKFSIDPMNLGLESPNISQALNESQNTAYFKDRLTSQSLLKIIDIPNKINSDEILECPLDPLEQKSYKETMLKFKKQDLIRKSYSATNKNIHRRMIYERNIVLFTLNVAERLQNQADSLDLDPQFLSFLLFLLAKLSFLLLQILKSDECVVKELALEEKKWAIYRKSLQYKEFIRNISNDFAICAKFMQQKRREIIEMLAEDPCQLLKLFGLKNNQIIDILSQTQENLKEFKEQFDFTLKRILTELEEKIKEMICKKEEDDEFIRENVTLAEDLMMLFSLKKYFKWQEGKEINFNKFIEDRQYMEVETIVKRVFQGFEDFRYGNY